MKVKVLALTTGHNFTDGQNIVSEAEEAYKHPQQIEYYMNTAKERGLEFGIEECVVEIEESELETWQEVYGVEVVDDANQAKEPQQMKIKVLALTVGEYFTDGQHLVNEIEAAYKHPEQIEYYLSTAKQRGLEFGVKEDFIEIAKEDFEMWHNVYGATPV